MGQEDEKESLPPPPLFEEAAEVPPVPQRMLTPGDLPADADGKLPFWKPTWGEIARGLGWSWLFVAPAILFVLGGTWMCISSWWWRWWWRWEWAAVLLAGVIGGIVGVVRQSIRSRDPFCIHCGYDLGGLPDNHVCPECGRRYSFELVRKYQQDPRWFIQCWEHEQVKRLLPPRS